MINKLKKLFPACSFVDSTRQHNHKWHNQQTEQDLVHAYLKKQCRVVKLMVATFVFLFFQYFIVDDEIFAGIQGPKYIDWSAFPPAKSVNCVRCHTPVVVKTTYLGKIGYWKHSKVWCKDCPGFSTCKVDRCKLMRFCSFFILHPVHKEEATEAKRKKEESTAEKRRQEQEQKELKKQEKALKKQRKEDDFAKKEANRKRKSQEVLLDVMAAEIANNNLHR